MRKRKGTVVSNKMEKTIVVRVDRLKQHPKYLKSYRQTRRFKVHVEDARAFQPGDRVVIGETRPMSKDKRWKVLAVFARRQEDEAAEEQEESST